ncbi:hypothetical protein [Acinetobacter soli]|uniref:hypothetical protein n=1 Tax=Acinetobacter soli TaxID=487316 RepID=UPI0006E3ED56|nr:hypothetical protein [Acinetobacter soli]KQC99154.1 hypothetical protein APD01_08800 [Acinetobacter soli]KQC99848.1 hypothetical protein APD01_07405 [Acinetobacter soli]KQD03323.1 hypothetical protein APD01_00210 [Acinetobacter soli]KQD05713.1 hypothetical protein APD01_01910 [Acinetobacter soli]
MADSIITKQELIDAQKDAVTLKDAVNGNESGVVTPRLNEPYPTLPAAIQKIESDGVAAVAKLENTGGFISAPTLTALQAITPEYDYQLARVDATGDEYRWNPALTTTSKWEATGRNFLSESKAYTDLKISFKQIGNNEIIALSDDGVQLFSISAGLMDFNPSDSLIAIIKNALDFRLTIDTSNILKDYEIIALSSDGVQLFATKKGIFDFNISQSLKDEIGSSNTLKKPSQNIIMYGSSLTSKRGEATSTLDGFVLPDTVPSKLIAPWEAVQAELPARTVASQAAGGQNIFQNAIRQGGRTMYVTLENNTLLASGDTNITAFGNFTVFNGQSISQSNVSILGIPCVLKPRTINGNDYAGLRLSRVASGQAISVPAGTPLVFENAVNRRDWTYIIEPNANWPQSPDYSGNYDLINCVLDMIKYASGAENISEVRYLIAGNTPAYTEPFGSYTRIRKQAREEIFKEYFKDKYMDCATYMVQHAIYDAVYLGYLPSVIQADLDDIAIGVIPRRMMHDVVHYNALGAYMLGRYYSLFIKAKGW